MGSLQYDMINVLYMYIHMSMFEKRKKSLMYFDSFEMSAFPGLGIISKRYYDSTNKRTQICSPENRTR